MKDICVYTKPEANELTSNFPSWHYSAILICHQLFFHDPKFPGYVAIMSYCSSRLLIYVRLPCTTETTLLKIVRHPENHTYWKRTTEKSPNPLSLFESHRILCVSNFLIPGVVSVNMVLDTYGKKSDLPM